MKKITHILVAMLLATGVMFQSCSSATNDEDPVSNDPETFVRFTADGTTYQYEDLGTIGSLRLVIQGQVGLSDDANFFQFRLWMPREPAPGTYEIFENGDYELALDSKLLNILNGEASEGTLTLDSVNEHFIRGTFSAVVSNDSGDTVTLTNGEFKAFGL